MAENRQAQNNAVSHQSADGNNIEEAMRRLKIHDNQDGGAVPQSGPYPDRPGEPDCIYYLRTGLCGYGNNCRFNHPTHVVQGAQYGEELPERAGQPDCGFFLKTGTCKYGSTCKYHHPKDRHGAGPVSFNLLNLPMRQDEKSCPYYMRTGTCKFGVACKFHHPQPAPVGSPSAAAYGSGSSIVPSSALPYVGGIPTWSGPRAPYMPTPRVPLPPSYMPIVLSPTQGLISAQGWNTYVGNMGPLSPSGILGSNLVYNSRNQGELNSSRQMPLVLASSGSDLPERPDQPECRYFMNNGTCKYGSDCKYHHPKERITQFATSTLGPLGLPLRPGQAVCSNYSMYGVCKYGPTCKFDHPFAGYPYNYSLGMPALSMIDTCVMKNSSLAHSSETSPSKSSKASRKSDTVVKDKKTSEDAPEQATSPPNSWTTSEPPPDQSD